MIVLRSTYLDNDESLKTHLDDHLTWVDDGYARGWFVASGLRDGGVGAAILAQGVGKGPVGEFLALDPFVVNGIAEYEVIEFEAVWTVPQLAVFS